MTDVEGRSTPDLGVVLVVDDEPRIRQLACRFLEESGYQVLEAEDGAQALTVLEGGGRIDFLMTDLDMPVMRGEAMAARIRAVRSDLKVLYVTGNSASLFETRPQLFDDEAFLEKPFTKKGLLEAVSLLRWGTLSGPPPAATPAPPSSRGRWWPFRGGGTSGDK